MPKLPFSSLFEAIGLKRLPFILWSLSICSLPTESAAQGPPPPLRPLTAPPAPAGNAVTAAKANLGKALFWDEQLSSTRTISCGTCHQPASGGVDPRAILGSAISTHPGPDGTLGTADDINGSPGVILNQADGSYSLEDFFGLNRQVTGRYAPSAINAGFSPSLFWDGRATTQFNDPITGAVVLANGAALESQAAGPPASSAEMAHAGRDWGEIETRIEGSRPLALADQIPAALETWINDQNYPALFTEAFGTPDVTAAKIVMAIATYERTLLSNQAPFDQLIAGNPNALTAQERLGQQIFGQSDCVACHGGNRLTDDRFHYIGVRPQNDDLGRFEVTGNNADRGRMKTPSLRNASLRGAYMHNGRFDTLMEVVEFYDRGGDFDAPNKDPNIRPLNLTQAEKDALVAFLGRPLTDPRVAAETAPFDRPSLYADSIRQPQISGTGVAGTEGHTPQVVAIEPPLAGNPGFTAGVFGALGGAEATLVIDTGIPPSGVGIPAEGSARFRLTQTLSGTGGGAGFGSASVSIPYDASLDGQQLFGRWYINDPEASGGISETEVFEFTVFGGSAGLVPTPANLSARFDQNSDSIEVDWDLVADAARYQVYRSLTDQFNTASLLSETPTNDLSDQTVIPGLEYFYWVVAVSVNEAGPASASVSSVPPLPGPENLTASDSTSAAEVALAWDPVANASSYSIYRSTTADTVTAAQIGTSATPTFSDPTSDAARSYSYWVTAMVDGNETQFSNAETGTRALATPTGLSASDLAFTDKISVTWSPGSVGFDNHRIFRSTTDEFGTASQIGISSGSTFDDASATPLETYFYWAVATNAHGSSSQSTSDSGARALPAPTNLTVSAGSNSGEVILSWDTGGGATSFRVYRSESDNFDGASLVGSTPATIFTDDTLTPGTAYFYWIEAANGDTVARADSIPVVTGEPQPDLALGSKRNGVEGNDIYSSPGAGQRLVLRTKKRRAAKAFALLENDGEFPASFAISGSRGNRQFSVKYYRVSAPYENITAAVRSAQYVCGEMAASQSESLQIKIKPAQKTSRGKRVYQLKLEAASVLSADFADLVKVKTIQKP